MASTLITLVFIPVFYVTANQARDWAGNRLIPRSIKAVFRRETAEEISGHGMPSGSDKQHGFSYKRQD